MQQDIRKKNGRARENNRLTNTSYSCNINKASLVVNGNELSFLTVQGREVTIINITCRRINLIIKAWRLAFAICMVSCGRRWSGGRRG
jgi:hypothetical protein